MSPAWDGSPQSSQFQPTQRGLDALFGRIETIERMLRAMSGANILGAADIKVDKLGMTVASRLTVLGDMVIGGTLSLPNGIIDNDALSAPTDAGSVGAGQSAFALGASPVTLAPQAITVPVGFSRAIVQCTADVSSVNGSGAGGYLYAAASIAGISGAETYTFVANGVGAGISATSIRSLTGLSGGTIAVAARVRAAAAWPGNPGNLATVNAIAVFLR